MKYPNIPKRLISAWRWIASIKNGKKWRVPAQAFVLFLGLVSYGHTYTVVTISTAAPSGLEKNFLATTTTYFQASVTTNPLAANTYAVKLFGPASGAKPLPPTTLQEALALGATVYVYGFAEGQNYERRFDLGIISSYTLHLSSSDSNCSSIFANIENEIYTMNFSTPTVIPPTGGF